MPRRSAKPRKFRRPLMGPLFWTVFAAIAVFLRLFLSSDDAAPEVISEGFYRVRYVVDGDTFVLENGVRVRLQGIDTPEVARDGRPGEPFSDDAERFTKAFVDKARGEVRLTFGDERLDRYGRSLAFVWHGEVMLNEALVATGLAEARPDYRFSGRMKRRLMDAQRQAQARRVGMWADAVVP